jgi:hypothetical protein
MLMAKKGPSAHGLGTRDRYFGCTGNLDRAPLPGSRVLFGWNTGDVNGAQMVLGFNVTGFGFEQ